MRPDHARRGHPAPPRRNVARYHSLRSFRRSRPRRLSIHLGKTPQSQWSRFRVTPLASLLAERIRRFGPITFAEYMRECLYNPVYGYYSQPESSRFADYYTSVDVHPIFGRLLARQFAEMWQQLDRPAEFLLVEAGAGVGRLAGHILEFAQPKLPEFYRSLRYIAIERSPSRCNQLTARLSRFVQEGKCSPSIEIPARIPAGCLFSNELLDALPIHRVLQQQDSLSEIFVTWDGTRFSELP